MQAVRQAIELGRQKYQSMSALGNAIGLSRSSLSAWYGGQIDRLDIEVLVRLFNEAGMSLSVLQGEEPESQLDQVEEKIDEALATLKELVQNFGTARLTFGIDPEPPADERLPIPDEVLEALHDSGMVRKRDSSLFTKRRRGG